MTTITTKPSYLEKVNAAANSFHHSIVGMKTSRSPDIQQAWIQTCAKALSKIAPERIDFSKESNFDLERLRELFCGTKSEYECLRLSNPQLFNKKTTCDIQKELNHLLAIFQSVEQALRSYKPSSQKPGISYNPMKDRVMDVGICYGHCHALIDEKLSPKKNVSELTLFQERERLARFYQTSCKLTDQFFFDYNDCQALGKKILASPSQFPLAIQIIANLLGYREKIPQFLKDLKANKTPMPLPAIEGLLGKFVLNRKDSAKEQIHSQQNKIDQLDQQRASLARKIEAKKKELEALEKTENDLEASKSALLNEEKSLDYALRNKATFAEVGQSILLNAQNFQCIIQNLAFQYGFPGNEEAFFQFLNGLDANNQLLVCDQAGRIASMQLTFLQQNHIALNQQLERARMEKEITSIQLHHLTDIKRTLCIELDQLKTVFIPFAQEQAQIRSLIAQMPPRRKEWLIPAKIMKKRGWVKKDSLFQNAPIAEAHKLLENFSNTKGEFILILHTAPGRCEHAIYFSFDPPCLSDYNDMTILDQYPKVRSFPTKEALLEEIKSLLLLTKWSIPLRFASLWHYEKSTPAQPRTSSNV